jgi:hypothetical protein
MAHRQEMMQTFLPHHKRIMEPYLRSISMRTNQQNSIRDAIIAAYEQQVQS